MNIKILAAGIASLLLASCSSSPDLSAVKAEQSKSVLRYDIIQSLAANGHVVVAGTQNGAVLASKDDGKFSTKTPPIGGFAGEKTMLPGKQHLSEPGPP